MSKLLALLLAATAAVATGETIFVVRHAERAGGMAADVGISDAGRCRAEGLARILADAGIQSIFTSEVARTQQTAEPLARKRNLKPEIVAARDGAILVARLRAGAAAGNVLVVGHSNTVPEIVKALSGTAVEPIADTEFDRLYIVTRNAAAPPIVVLLRYPGCTP